MRRGPWRLYRAETLHMLWRRLTAAAVASVLDLFDEISAEVDRIRGGNEPPGTPHRYDPASTTDYIAERAYQGGEHEAYARPAFGFTRAKETS